MDSRSLTAWTSLCATLIVCLASLCSCTTTPVAPAPPPRELPLETAVIAGNPLEGLGRAAPERPAEALVAERSVSLRWQQLTTPLPTADSEPVGAEVSFVRDPQGEMSPLSLPRIATGLRWYRAPAPQPNAPIGSSHPAQSEGDELQSEMVRLPSQGTIQWQPRVEVEAAAATGAELPPTLFVWSSVRGAEVVLQLSRDGDVEWALLGEVAAGESRELWIPRDDGHWRLRWSCGVLSDSAGDNTVQPASGFDEYERHWENDAQADLTVSEIRRKGLLYFPTQRRTLFNLAVESGADLTREVALVAADVVVSKVAEHLTHAEVMASSERVASSEVNSSDTPSSARAVAQKSVSLGMRLERSTLLQLSVSVESEVATGVEALLVQRLGECGRHPTSLEQLAASETLEQLRQRIIDENMLFLGASRAKSRVRACDWLRGEGHALDGYDPLAEAAVRREALRRLQEETPQ